MKNTHKTGCVRPIKMIKAIAFLKDKGNPYYKDVILRCLFCQRKFEDTDHDIFEHTENYIDINNISLSSISSELSIIIAFIKHNIFEK